MEFQEGHLFGLLFGQTQHLKIPDFQRSYSWDKKMWTTLWIDVLNQYKIHADLEASGLSESDIHAGLSRMPTHYLGAIVTTSGNAMIPPPSDVLDGQQRLLTSSVLYLAVRDSILRSLGTGVTTADEAQDIRDTFRAAFLNQTGNEKTRYRLLTQDVDRAAWHYLLSPQRPIGLVTKAQFMASAASSDRVIQAFNFFYREMNRTSLDGNKQGELEFATDLFPLDPAIMRSVVETRLSLVRLLCSPNDDANAIFESLNAKSEPLKQVDLIKNYIYISLPAEEASAIYRETWRPMEERVEYSRIERFVWAVVVSKGHTTLQKRTYEKVRSILANKPKGEIRRWVEDLAKEARYYKSIVLPETEVNAEVKVALKSVQSAGGSTMEPLLMYGYRAWSEDRVTTEDFVASLYSIESFLVRRMLTGERTQLLNPIVTSMINRLYAEDGEYTATGHMLDDIRRVLSAPEFGWPDSDSVLRGISTSDFYHAQKPEQRQHILRTLDRHLNTNGVETNYEDSDKSIEHIVPQTSTAEWLSEGENRYSPEILERLHSLSNLTLLPASANASLGNKGWSDKVAVYAVSPYSLTKSIATSWGEELNWGATQLALRADALRGLVDHIWPRIPVERRFVKQSDSVPGEELVDEFDLNDEELILDDE